MAWGAVGEVGVASGVGAGVIAADAGAEAVVSDAEVLVEVEADADLAVCGEDFLDYYSRWGRWVGLAGHGVEDVDQRRRTLFGECGLLIALAGDRLDWCCMRPDKGALCMETMVSFMSLARSLLGMKRGQRDDQSN